MQVIEFEHSQPNHREEVENIQKELASTMNKLSLTENEKRNTQHVSGFLFMFVYNNNTYLVFIFEKLSTHASCFLSPSNVYLVQTIINESNVAKIVDDSYP